MSDPRSPRPLPARPSLDQLRKQAKELRDSGEQPTLTAAQRALSKRYGFATWPKLKLGVALIQLRLAITTRDIKRVRELLDESPTLPSFAFSDGRRPLHIAAESNQPDMVELLVKRGAPLDAKFGTSAHSALSWALTSEATDAAKKLVDLGVDPDLFCAAGLGDLERVKSFWREGHLRPTASKTGSSRTTVRGDRLPAPPASDADQVSDALYLSSRLGHIDVARYLLDHAADPNWRGYGGATCLAWAHYAGSNELCELLRARGARDDLTDFAYGAAPSAFGVMVTANWGFFARLRSQLTRDPSLVLARARIGSPLHAAAAEGQGKCAFVLMEFGVDKAALDARGRTAAEVAVERGYAELASQLR